jgi:hypothetical protein
MGVDCGRCEGFRVHAERYYRPLLDRHGFRLVDCADGHDGRECMVMYRSDRCQLLLSLFDGSDDCILGGLEQPFPGLGLRRTDGQDGWYHVVPLIEWLAEEPPTCHLGRGSAPACRDGGRGPGVEALA